MPITNNLIELSCCSGRSHLSRSPERRIELELRPESQELYQYSQQHESGDADYHLDVEEVDVDGKKVKHEELCRDEMFSDDEEETVP